MSNFFEELNKQGIIETEMSLQELQNLLIEGKISETQFTKILIDNLGEKKFMETMTKTLQQTYGKNFLTNPLPKDCKIFMEETNESKIHN